MRKIKIYESDGKSADERETCFPRPNKMDRVQEKKNGVI